MGSTLPAPSPFSFLLVRSSLQAAPIVRVAVEPADPGQMQQLAEGLRLLNRADPFVEVALGETGACVCTRRDGRRQRA